MKDIKSFLASHGTLIGFLGFLILFVGLKIPYLDLPYYWDEAWVYANAVNHFAHEGLSILPADATNELTRGHPMLFHFLFSLWGTIFGSSALSFHAAALLLSCLLLIFLFFRYSTFTSRETALIAISFLMGYEIFFVQSNLLLPEVMLGSFIAFSMYYYICEKYFWSSLFFTLALYTKESAIVLLPLFVLMILFDFFFLGKNKNTILQSIAIIVPLVIAFFHYLYQKISFGWYFYPLHIDYIDVSIKAIVGRFDFYIFSLFVQNFCWLMVLIFLGLIFYNVWKRESNNLKNLCLYSLSAAFMALLLHLSTGNLITIFSVLFIGSVSISIFLIFDKNSLASKFNLMAWVFIVGYLAFSALNFATVRYAIPVVIIFAILFSQLLYETFKASSKLWFSLAPLMFLFLWILSNQSHSLGDVDKDYKYAVMANQELVKYMVSTYDKNDPVCAEFLERVSLENHYAGYIDKDKEFTQLLAVDHESMLVKIISNREQNLEDQRRSINSDFWRLAHTIHKRGMHYEVYTRIDQ